MADCASLPSCIHLQMHQIQHRTTFSGTRNACIRMLKREQFFAKGNILNSSRSPEGYMAGAHICAFAKGSLYLKKSFSRCCCMGELTNPESLLQLNWVPIADQVLLMASMIFTYMAGAVPQKGNFHGTRNEAVSQASILSGSTSYGRSAKRETQTCSNYVWGEVEAKLADALTASEHDGNIIEVRYESYSKKHPFCLFALAGESRMRLLWSTLQHLKNEVNDISQTHEVVGWDNWLVSTSDVIQGSVLPVCIKWLKEELGLEIHEPNKKLISRISGSLKGNNTVLQNIDRSGKAELYAYLLFFLKFGCSRTGCYYDNDFFSQYAVDILEDLVIMLADGITSIYLELISVDSSMSVEINGLGPTLCSLSTRALQRLRNEVALNQWLQQYFESVILMYEDRFELFVLFRKQLDDPSLSQNEKYSWWNKLSFRKLATPSRLHSIQINPISLPVKRTKELRALTGWRYYFSLFLEFSDITMPLIRAVFAKVRDAVSFFLVCLIGRSLGLIYSGIRQSLGWR